MKTLYDIRLSTRVSDKDERIVAAIAGMVVRASHGRPMAFMLVHLKKKLAEREQLVAEYVHSK